MKLRWNRRAEQLMVPGRSYSFGDVVPPKILARLGEATVNALVAGGALKEEKKRGKTARDD